MSKVEELEKAIEALPEEEFVQLRQWFSEKDWRKWDQQIEEDTKSGKLNFLLQEALEAKSKNKLRTL
ncbi:MAG: hypothetical protein ACYC69_05425 [Thermodesulfovibrionales bacterium]